MSHRVAGRHRRIGTVGLDSQALAGAPASPESPPATTGPGSGAASPSPAGKLASNMLASALGNAVTPVAALLSMPVLTYALGVEGRGEVAAATAPLLLAATIGTLGFPEAVTYLLARSPTLFRVAVRRGFAVVVVAGLAATFACFLAAGPLSGRQHSVQHLIVVASSTLVPTMLVLVLRAAAAGLHRWRLVAVEQGTCAVLRLIGIGGLAVVGELTPLTATVVLAVTPALGGLAYVRLGHGLDARMTAASAGQQPLPMRPMVSFASRIWVGSLSGVLLSRLDQVLMTPLSGTYQLGLYAVAVNVSDVALILHSAVRDVTFAADATARDDERLCASARISGVASFCVGLVLALGLPMGLPVVFGHAFSPAIPSAFVLLAAVVLVSPGSVAGAGLSARGRPGLRSISLLAASIVNVLGLLVLVPRFGAIGAAWATFVGNVVFSQLNIFFLHRVSAIPARGFYGLRSADLVAIARTARGMRRLTSFRVSPSRDSQ